MQKIRAYNVALSLVAVLVLMSASSAAQTDSVTRDPPIPSKRGAVEKRPLDVFKRVERAWMSGNAQALADLASDSKVLVKIRGMERRGEYFTKPQLYYIFKGIFESTSQTSFAFVKYHNLEKQGSRVYGMALRSYKSNQSGGLYQDRVYVTLAREGSRWAVTEIKSTW